jgi:hypothetical protein
MNFPMFCGSPKVQYRVHNSPQLAPIVSRMNAVYIIPSYLSKTHFNIITPPTSSTRDLFPFCLSYKHSSALHTCYGSAHPKLLYFIIKLRSELHIKHCNRCNLIQKLLTGKFRPLVREGAPQRRKSNLRTEQVPEWARRLDILTDWPSVVTWLWPDRKQALLGAELRVPSLLPTL